MTSYTRATFTMPMDFPEGNLQAVEQSAYYAQVSLTFLSPDTAHVWGETGRVEEYMRHIESLGGVRLGNEDPNKVFHALCAGGAIFAAVLMAIFMVFLIIIIYS